MLSIGTCRLCESGPLGLRRCGVCRRVVVLCDECDAAWRRADTAGKPTYATEDDMPCPACGGSLLSRGGARWATREEAPRLPGLGDTELEEGTALEPRSGD